MYIYPHTSYQTLSSLPNPGRSKYLFIDTQVIKLYPLNRTLVGLSMYLSTHNAIKHYPLFRKLVGLCVNLSTHKAINLYPLYRTMVCLSMVVLILTLRSGDYKEIKEVSGFKDNWVITINITYITLYFA